MCLCVRVTGLLSQRFLPSFRFSQFLAVTLRRCEKMCRLTVREDAEEGGKTKEEGSESERERESSAVGGGECEEEKGGHIVDNVLLH